MNADGENDMEFDVELDLHEGHPKEQLTLRIISVPTPTLPPSFPHSYFPPGPHGLQRSSSPHGSSVYSPLIQLSRTAHMSSSKRSGGM